MSPQPSGDLTPISGSPTDVAPLGSSTPPSAADQVGQAKWDAIAADPAFAELKATKRRVIIPGTIFFLIYYMTLPILVGFFPAMMKTPVLGKVNWAYIYALSQFAMTWILCAVYVRAANRWDIMNAALLAKHRVS
jgi:uncharacterized membrane protein (DUF485 family)